MVAKMPPDIPGGFARARFVAGYGVAETRPVGEVELLGHHPFVAIELTVFQRDQLCGETP